MARNKDRLVNVDVDTAKRLGIVTMKAGEQGSRMAITVPGTIEYDLNYYAEVGPRLDGRITNVHVRLGDRVTQGQLLAEMAVPTLAEAQASALMARAALAAAEKNADRERGLLQRQLTTARESEVAESELARVKAEVSAAEARLQALGVGGSAIGGMVRLTAPIAGTVVQRHAVLGGYLAASSNAFVIAETSRLMAVLDFAEADLPYLQLSSAVTFNADGLPGKTFEGKLAYIDPTVGKQTRMVRARVIVENPDGSLRPGMFVRAMVSLPSPLTGGVLLPPQAIQPLGNDDVAFVERGAGVYEVRKLVLGRRTSEVVEVREGISKGDTVVVEGAFLLRGEAAKQ